MKAIKYRQFGPPSVLEIVEEEKPEPRAIEVRVCLHATTVTRTDSQFRMGKPFIARLAAGLFKPSNQGLGGDFAGVVDSCGHDVRLFKGGEAVFGTISPEQGTNCEYICVDSEAAIIEIPEGFTFEEAAAIPDGALTALPYLRDLGEIKEGEHILINGASGAVGSAAVQLAKYFGAEVSAVASQSSHSLLQSLGADRCIDYQQEDFTQSTVAYDIIFDAVGMSSFSAVKKVLKPNGKYLSTVPSLGHLFSMLSGGKKGKKSLFMATGLRSPEKKRDDLLFFRTLMEEGKLIPVIDKSFPLEKAAEAHTYVDLGHKKGNVVLRIRSKNN